MKFDERALLTLSSGIMAGFAEALTLVAVPAIKESADPLPSWQRLYKNGSKMALSLIFISTAAGIKCYLKTEDLRYLFVSGLSFGIVPYTVIFMKPVNDALFAITPTENGQSGKDSKVRQLIAKWEKLQYVRTFLGVSAFLVNVVIIYKKCK